jgi:RHS repeat-associated protein
VSGNNGLSYFYSDHLGSASALQKPNATMAYTWYLPFGGYRPGSAPTQSGNGRDFTGQRENMELGLLYYNARFYAPTLGRFISADTIIPNPANPQSYNRYSYGYNNPLTFRDPTGHISCTDPNLPEDDQQACQGESYDSADSSQELVSTLVQVPVVQSGPEDVRAAELIPVVCTSSECDFLDFLFPVYLARPGATPGFSRSAEWRLLGKSLSAAGAAVDMFSTAISGAGISLQLGTTGLAGPIGPDDALAHLAYPLVLDRLENAVSWIGSGFTVAADLASGGSNINFQTGEVIVGQDSIVLLITSGVGNYTGSVPVAGPSLDTAVNLTVNAYDIGRLSGHIPTVMEFRWDEAGPYAVLYLSN